MEISAQAVFALRAKTGVSILQCKKALEEANGDESLAIDILRSKGEAQAVKKADRAQGEGYIFGSVSSGKGALLTLLCETDFVARNTDFQALGQKLVERVLSSDADTVKNSSNEDLHAAIQQLGENITIGSVEVVEGTTIGSYIHTNGKVAVLIALNGGTTEIARDTAMHAAAMRPEFTSPDEVSQAVIDKEKEIWTEQLKAEGKSEEIMSKIMIGKEKKFREENALLTQNFVKNPDQTIAAFIGDAKIVGYKLMTV